VLLTRLYKYADQIAKDQWDNQNREPGNASRNEAYNIYRHAEL
jgi:hypothetical protein